MGSLHFEIGKKFTLTKTFAESDVYLFAGIIGDLFPAHVNEAEKHSRFHHCTVEGARIPPCLCQCRRGVYPDFPGQPALHQCDGDPQGGSVGQ